MPWKISNQFLFFPTFFPTFFSTFFPTFFCISIFSARTLKVLFSCFSGSEYCTENDVIVSNHVIYVTILDLKRATAAAGWHKSRNCTVLAFIGPLKFFVISLLIELTLLNY